MYMKFYSYSFLSKLNTGNECMAELMKMYQEFAKEADA